MAWTIEFTDQARRQFKALDRSDAARIRRFLTERLADTGNPRTLGRALKGSELGGYWRFRVGDYRLVCEIQDSRLVILVIAVGHRRDVYR